MGFQIITRKTECFAGKREMILRAAAKLYRLKRNEWLSPQALKEMQWRKFKKLLRHAYEKVPYYHRLFKTAGIRPEDIKDRQDLSKIPLTTKSKIQNLSPEELMAKGIDKNECIELRTSGSTGKPLSVYLTKREKEFRVALWAWSSMCAGLRFRDKSLHIVSAPNEKPARQYWFQRLGIIRRDWRSIFEEETFETLEQGNIDVLSSLPSVFKLIIEHLERKGCSRLRPRLLFATAEVLDAPTRQEIENFFQAPIFDFYGLAEVDVVAWQHQPCGGFHLNSNNQLVEFVRKGRAVAPGQRGRIIVTSLHSYAMPFIRYDTEDVGVLSPKRCSCGRALPLLERLEGRCDDFITLAGGRHFSSQIFRRITRTVEGLKQYKVVQENEDQLLIYLVVKPGSAVDACKSMKEKVGSVLGKEVKIKCNVVDNISRPASGKNRTVISYVPPDF
jgi:phenylacetate-CoA ligase